MSDRDANILFWVSVQLKKDLKQQGSRQLEQHSFSIAKDVPCLRPRSEVAEHDPRFAPRTPPLVACGRQKFRSQDHPPGRLLKLSAGRDGLDLDSNRFRLRITNSNSTS